MKFLILLCLLASVFARPLNLLDEAPVDSKFVEQITLLEQDPLTFVENRLVSQLQISPEEAASYKLGFQQWISLNFLVNSSSPAASPGPFVPSMQVDEFWHNFILYTRKYQAWCFKNFGHFIHHVPEEESSGPAVDEHDKSWAFTVALMKELYGVNWGSAVHEDGTCTAGCSMKGGYCQSGNCKPGICQATGGPTTTAGPTTTTTAAN